MTIRAATFRSAQEAVDFLNTNGLGFNEVHGPNTNASGFIDVIYDDSATISDLLGDSSSPVTLGTSYSAGTTSSAISTIGQKYAVFWVYVSVASTATQIDMQVEVAESATSSDWVPLQAESVSSGVATQDTYEIQKAFTGTGLILASSIPVRGLPAMRIKVKADAGTPQVYVRYAGS